MPLLETLAIELTNICNERCKHCYIPDKLKSGNSKISYEKLCSIIDEFVLLGGENVLFTGGEILLYKNLLNILDYAHTKGLWIALFFNAIALTDEHISKFKEIGVNDIQVSLYSINSSTHDSITKVKGSCERTKNSIERLTEAGLPVRIACSVIKDNMNEICELLDYTLSRNLKLGLEFSIIASYDKNDDNLQFRLTPGDLEQCFRALASHNPEYTKQLLRRIDRTNKNKLPFEEFLNEPVCGAAQNMLYITPDTKYSICPGWVLEGSNLDSDVSLKDVWENNEFLNEVRTLKERSFPQCLNCEAFDYCVRCYARNYLETGDYIKPPEFACQYAFIAKKIIESIK